MSLQSLNLKKIGVEVRLRADNQFGVFSTTRLPTGFVIHSVRPTFLFRSASRYTIQVGESEHLGTPFLGFAQFLNHSCASNLAVRVMEPADPAALARAIERSNSDPSESGVLHFGDSSASGGSAAGAPLLHITTAQEVPADTELTFNYLTTEWEMNERFTCSCGAPTCFGRIEGFAYLSPDKQRELLPLLAPHLRAHMPEEPMTTGHEEPAGHI